LAPFHILMEAMAKKLFFGLNMSLIKVGRLHLPPLIMAPS
jgi:hypothetical protein